MCKASAEEETQAELEHRIKEEPLTPSIVPRGPPAELGRTAKQELPPVFPARGAQPFQHMNEERAQTEARNLRHYLMIERSDAFSRQVSARKVEQPLSDMTDRFQ